MLFRCVCFFSFAILREKGKGGYHNLDEGLT